MSTTRVTNGTTDNTLSSSSTIQTRSAGQVQDSSSTVRFATDTAAPSEPARSSRRAVASSDEVTPIKRFDSHGNRSYNTSDTTLPVQAPKNVANTNAVSQQTSRQTDSSASTKVESSPPWYKKVADKYGSISLENKASVARDHLALERTFLAWLRTSLSFASIGIAITQLFRLNSSISSRPAKRAPHNHYDSLSTSASLPFSPFLGHAIPAELLPYLQSMATHAAPSLPKPTLGPTLLDQLLLLSPEGTPVESGDFPITALNDVTTDRLRHVGKPLGATFIGISIVVLLVGFQRYFEAQHWIIHGKFPASRGSISLVAFVAFALIIASLVVIIVISPESYER